MQPRVRAYGNRASDGVIRLRVAVDRARRTRAHGLVEVVVDDVST